MSIYKTPYALWRSNLIARVYVRTTYPLAAYSFSLMKLGIFVSPSLFSSTSPYSTVQDSKIGSPANTVRASLPVKPIFNRYSCVEGSSKVILSNAQIMNLLECFWRDVFEENKDRFILAQLRIKSGPNYYSLSKIQAQLGMYHMEIKNLYRSFYWIIYIPFMKDILRPLSMLYF